MTCARKPWPSATWNGPAASPARWASPATINVPLFLVQIALPSDLTLDVVVAPGDFAWSISPDASRQVLTLFFESGMDGTLPIVLRGQLGAPSPQSHIPLPQIAVLNIPEQSGDWVVQTDPAFDVKASDLTHLQPVLLQHLEGWLQRDQFPLSRLALRCNTLL